jgi:hypothetical protein
MSRHAVVYCFGETLSVQEQEINCASRNLFEDVARNISNGGRLVYINLPSRNKVL